MESVNLKINGIPVTTAKGTTILEAARTNGIEIPTLCYLKEINQGADCRICMVELQGNGKLVPACVTQVSEGMAVLTHSDIVVASRKRTLRLLCENHRFACEECMKYEDCPFHNLLIAHGITEKDYRSHYVAQDADKSAQWLVKDHSKCVKCRRCVEVCDKKVFAPLMRGNAVKIGSPVALVESDCNACGRCAEVCPTGALYIPDDTGKIWDAYLAEKKKLVAILSGQVGQKVASFFGAQDPNGNKLAEGLKKIGFAEVYAGDDVEAIAGNIREDQPSNYIVSIEESPAAKEFCRPDVDAAITVKETIHLIQTACVSRYTACKVWETLSGVEFDAV